MPTEIKKNASAGKPMKRAMPKGRLTVLAIGTILRWRYVARNHAQLNVIAKAL